MRVLIIHPYMTFYGGAELVIVRLANYLKKRKIKNAVLTLDISPELKRELRGSEIILPKEPLRFSPRMPYTLTLLPAVLTLRKYLKKNVERFDVVNVHNFPAEFVAPSCHKKVIWMCNEPPKLHFAGSSPIEKILGKVITTLDKRVVRKHVNCVCVADEFNARRFEDIYGMKPVVIPYGVDYEFFSKGDESKASRKFGISEDDFVLLQVGVLTPFKNQLESLKSVKVLKDKIPEIKLVLAGHGENEYEKMLRRYVHECGLKKHVIFTGHLQRTEIRDLYAACDVALFPVKPQGGWLSPFEALCACKPIVVSTQMTASDLIKKNKIGEVTKDFEKVILKIYENGTKYQKIAKRGCLWTNRNLGWDKFCEKMVTCFRN